MFAVEFLNSKKQRAKRKKQEKRVTRVTSKVAFCRLLFAFCFSNRGGIFERQKAKSKKKRAKSNKSAQIF